jgi:hypothetical protein
MTSIMHPGTYARLHAVRAQDQLALASLQLRGVTPRNDGMPGTGLPVEPTSAAAAHATHAATLITTALEMQNQLSAGVVTALGGARDEARSGAQLLTSPPANVRIDRLAVALQFDAASMWLGLATNLIDLDMRGPVAPRPTDPPMETFPNPVGTR